MLHWTQVWKHMRRLTGKDIEKRAVMTIITHVEAYIDELIVQSEKEQNKLNNNRRTQCIKEKKRIDDECINRAIKILAKNSIHDGHRNGGKKRKEGVKDETHSQYREHREVEIS